MPLEKKPAFIALMRGTSTHDTGEKTERLVKVKVSSKMMRLMFQHCTLEHVRNVCNGKCCQGSGVRNVVVVPEEAQKFISQGALVENGILVPDAKRKRCVFKNDDGTCRVHESKPLGCSFSPFTLNRSNTLIVRRRYICMKDCYGGDNTIVAYKAHAWSLAQLFGEKEAKRITAILDGGAGDFDAYMPAKHYNAIRYGDAAHARVKNDY